MKTQKMVDKRFYIAFNGILAEDCGKIVGVFIDFSHGVLFSKHRVTRCFYGFLTLFCRVKK